MTIDLDIYDEEPDYNEAEVNQLLVDCINREEMLNDWERKFIQHLDELRNMNKRFTERQRETLDRIWEKATS